MDENDRTMGVPKWDLRRSCAEKLFGEKVTLLVPKKATPCTLRNLLYIHRKAPGATDQGFLVGLGKANGLAILTSPSQ